MRCFTTSSEEVKSAASFSLGRICIGNLQFYLPTVLGEVQKQVGYPELLLY